MIITPNNYYTGRFYFIALVTHSLDWADVVAIFYAYLFIIWYYQELICDKLNNYLVPPFSTAKQMI